MDVVNSIKRSQMMSGIKGKNTKPELFVRSYLHAAGFRFRLHRNDLPGRPDLALKKYRLVIFVNGCFWHRHEGCIYKTYPSSRKDFWERKFEGNIQRDKKYVEELVQTGWRVLVIWECGIKHSFRELECIQQFITSKNEFMIWPSKPPRSI